MKFGDPSYLHFLWLMVPFLFFMVWGLKKKKQLTANFCGNPLLSRLVHPGVEKAQRKKAIFIVLAIIFLVFALSGSASLLISSSVLNAINLKELIYFYPLYLLVRIILLIPIYQLVLIIIATLFGEFRYFWNFEKKFFKRLRLIK